MERKGAFVRARRQQPSRGASGSGAFWVGAGDARLSLPAAAGTGSGRGWEKPKARGTALQRQEEAGLPLRETGRWAVIPAWKSPVLTGRELELVPGQR